MALLAAEEADWRRSNNRTYPSCPDVTTTVPSAVRWDRSVIGPACARDTVCTNESVEGSYVWTEELERAHEMGGEDEEEGRRAELLLPLCGPDATWRMYSPSSEEERGGGGGWWGNC